MERKGASRSRERDLHGSWLDARPADEERHAHVELEREALALDQPELAQVVAVVRRVDYVRVVELA